MPEPFQLGVICDDPSENWPSMTLCGEQLLKQLHAAPDVVATNLTPTFRPFLQRIPGFGANRAVANADRMLNRHARLTWRLARLRSKYDWFHFVDHSYALAGLALPRDRYGVFCYDLEAFRCLLDPASPPRSRVFRLMTDGLLRGLRRARVVFHATREVGRQLLHHRLTRPENLVLTPLGVSAEYHPPQQSRDPDAAPYLLHVGSTVPRKRIDTLLQVFAALRPRFPHLRLKQIGGTWTASQIIMMETLGLTPHVDQYSRLDSHEVARWYQQASVVMMTSDVEGFGLPVLEALACGAIVVASDIPTLREVGGPAVLYCPVGDVRAWRDTIAAVLARECEPPPLDARMKQAGLYTWERYSRIIHESSLRLARPS